LQVTCYLLFLTGLMASFLGSLPEIT